MEIFLLEYRSVRHLCEEFNQQNDNEKKKLKRWTAWTAHEMLQWIGLHVSTHVADQWDIWRWRWSYDKCYHGSASYLLWLMCDLCGKIQVDDDDARRLLAVLIIKIFAHE